MHSFMQFLRKEQKIFLILFLFGIFMLLFVAKKDIMYLLFAPKAKP